jgi:hypothetical protein
MSNEAPKRQFCQTDVSGSTFINADCFDVFPFIEDKSQLMLLFAICLMVLHTACKWDSNTLPLDKLWEQYKSVF